MPGDSSLEFDVIIVGAGPAGCMAALAAPTGMRVLLVDALPLPRDVICGGIISRWSMQLLAPLSVPGRVFCDPKIIGWKLYDWQLQRRGLIRNDFYFNASRRLLDGWMLDLAASHPNVEVWPQTRFLSAVSARSGEAMQIGLRGREGTLNVAARYLVGADGARSRVRQAAGCPAVPGTWITIQEEIGSDGAAIGEMLAFIDDGIDFYGWVIPKDDELVIGAGYDPARGDPTVRFRRFRLDLSERMGINGSVKKKPRARRATRLRGVSQVDGGTGNILLAGEAAGLICPWSGEGIAYALHSGAAAGRSLAASSPRAAYDRALRRLFPWLIIDLMGRKIMKRPSRRLAAASVFPRSSLRRFAPVTHEHSNRPRRAHYGGGPRPRSPLP